MLCLILHHIMNNFSKQMISYDKNQRLPTQTKFKAECEANNQIQGMAEKNEVDRRPKTGDDKIIELEKKLKKYKILNKELQSEKRSLEQELKRQTTTREILVPKLNSLDFKSDYEHTQNQKKHQQNGKLKSQDYKSQLDERKHKLQSINAEIQKFYLDDEQLLSCLGWKRRDSLIKRDKTLKSKEFNQLNRRQSLYKLPETRKDTVEELQAKIKQIHLDDQVLERERSDSLIKREKRLKSKEFNELNAKCSHQKPPEVRKDTVEELQTKIKQIQSSHKILSAKLQESQNKLKKKEHKFEMAKSLIRKINCWVQEQIQIVQRLLTNRNEEYDRANQKIQSTLNLDKQRRGLSLRKQSIGTTNMQSSKEKEDEEDLTLSFGKSGKESFHSQYNPAANVLVSPPRTIAPKTPTNYDRFNRIVNVDPNGHANVNQMASLIINPSSPMHQNENPSTRNAFTPIDSAKTGGELYQARDPLRLNTVQIYCYPQTQSCIKSAKTHCSPSAINGSYYYMN